MNNTSSFFLKDDWRQDHPVAKPDTATLRFFSQTATPVAESFRLRSTGEEVLFAPPFRRLWTDVSLLSKLALGLLGRGCLWP